MKKHLFKMVPFDKNGHPYQLMRPSYFHTALGLLLKDFGNTLPGNTTLPYVCSFCCFKQNFVTDSVFTNVYV